MTSEIRANTIKNRVGLGTVSFTNTGVVVSGIVTANSFSGPLNSTGDITSTGNITISNTTPTLTFTDTDANPDFQIKANTGHFYFVDATNNQTRFYVSPDGGTNFEGNLNANKDFSVDGHTNLDNVSIAGITTITGDFKVTGAGNGRVEIETQTARAVIRASSGLGIYGETGENNNANLSLHPTGNAVYTNLFFYNTAGSSYASIIGHAGGTLFFTGGSNSPLRHRVSGTGFHSFQEGNTQRVTITAGGTVNIGGDFTNTTGKLKVTGNSIFYGNGGASVEWGDTGYIGHLSYDASNNAVIRAASGAALIFQTNHVNERLRITSGGQVRLPINGQELTWGSSQQMKFYYDNSEERMYLQGDGAYGFAFRINSGNRIEIDKTTGDVTMQGASGRNFQWDNSEASLYLTDNGSGSSGRLKIGSGGDLQLYHDASNNINFITAATNGIIKISGGIEFYDYTGNTKRAVIDSNGLRIGTVSSPSLPTTGKPPMIMRTETNFTKEVHRTISDYRSVGDGTHGGYLLLIRAWPGTNQVGKKFYGTIMCDRGSTGSGNSTQVARVHASTAYNNDKLIVEVDTLEQYITAASKVTYGGVDYLALKFGSGGGGPNHGIHIDGTHRGTDNNFLKLVRDNEVSVVDDYYGSYSTSSAYMPTCAAFITGMTGSTFDGGVLSSGTVRYQYAPAGQSSPYNSSNGQFTARVSGIYLVTGGVLVEQSTGRLEGGLQWYNGSTWQTYVRFNGTGTQYDGPTFTCMIPLKEGYIIRMNRDSGNAYDPGHAQHYFGAHLLNALRRQDVPI